MFPIVGADATLEDLALPAFIVARDGLYLRKHSLLGLSQTQVERVAHLPKGREFIDYALPKLPAELLARVVGFFRAVYRQQHSEAVVLLLWGADGFDVAVPTQQASAASVRFKVRDDDVLTGTRVVGTIHSHGAFGAGASGIDEADEAELDGLHVVVGDLDRRRPSFSAAIAIDGRRFDVRLREVADRPGRPIDPPTEWLGRVKRLPPPRTTTKSIAPVIVSPPRGRPSRAELDSAIERASKLATALDYRLSYWLVPVSAPRTAEGSDDA